MRIKTFTTPLITLLITSTSFCCAEEYKGFVKLNPDECLPVEKKVTVSQLPKEWHKYADFIKICNLKHKETPTGQISIISVWVLDYYNAKFPAPASRKLENFPLPLIVDKRNNLIGNLPQQYPDDPPRELDVYYKECEVGISPEILIDVFNPAVSGSYYYKPLKWNIKKGKYEMKDLEVKNGKRK